MHWWKHIPILGSVPGRLRLAWQRRELGRCVRRLQAGETPDSALLQHLSWCWGNEGYSGDCSYLQQVIAAARQADGPVLECGSGLTTLLLAIYAGGRGLPVYSLEHMAQWQAHVMQTLARTRLPGTVLLTSIGSHGEFDWYQLPEEVPGGIRLVICDGPPGATRGGRFGLLPVCRPRLAPGCTILLDDAEREAEQKAVARWTTEYGLDCQLQRSQNGCFAELTVPAHAEPGSRSAPAVP